MRIQALLPAAALLLGIGAGAAVSASVGTAENTQYLFLQIGEEVGALPGTSGLLNVPPGWMTGDAVAVVAAGGEWPAGQRDRLVSALLDAGASVLEMNAPPAGLPRDAALEVALTAALRMSSNVLGAGLVVAVGEGEGGAAVLRAADAAERAGGEHFAAAVRLGPGEPVFHLGSVPQDEAWSARAPLFCDLLAGAVAENALIGSACHASLAAFR
jgi:hypothetical protein